MPLQNPLCLRRDFETFAHALIFNPENFAAASRSNQESMPALARNLLVHKKILKLDRVRHADGLEPIARPPVPQFNLLTDSVCIKEFCPRTCSRPFCTTQELPRDAN